MISYLISTTCTSTGTHESDQILKETKENNLLTIYSRDFVKGKGG